MPEDSLGQDEYPKPFVELRTDPGEMDITLITQDNQTYTVDATEVGAVDNLLKRHNITTYNNDLMIDALWNFHLILWWPPEADEKVGRFEVL